jgi:phosphoribosylformimino-5-aminoimidazole carboxamide ribotide isomerase
VRIIPVIDLRDGTAVHGRSGERAGYQPVRSRILGGPPRDLSDPLELLAAYRHRLCCDLLYVADLDRIEGRGSNDDVVARLLAADAAVRILWDGGLQGPPGPGTARPAAAPGRLLPIVATETLGSLQDLSSPAGCADPAPVLGLDLSEAGVVSRSPALAGLGELAILRQAAQRGVERALVLFLRRVGTGSGLPFDRLRRLRRAALPLELYVGGGVAGAEDLLALARAGMAGVLVATALHDGRLDPARAVRIALESGALKRPAGS